MDPIPSLNPDLVTLIPETGGSDDFISLLGPPTLTASPNPPPNPIPPPVNNHAAIQIQKTPPPIMVTTPVAPITPKTPIIASTSGSLLKVKPASFSWLGFFKPILVLGIMVLVGFFGFYLYSHVNLGRFIQSENSSTILIPGGLLILGVGLIFGGYILQKNEAH
jgi:hypothetical protein